MCESLQTTKKWREQYEKDNNIKYFDEMSSMILANDGELHDYEKLAENMNNEFDDFIKNIDDIIGGK